jgi:Domain of unknown function (DUF5060)
MVLIPLIVVLLLIRGTVTAQEIFTGFTLIQSPSSSLGPVPKVVNLTEVGRSLNIRAVTKRSATAIKRVVFYYDGKQVRSEAVVPYALGGDYTGYYKSYAPLTTLGSHNVTAVAIDTLDEWLDVATVTFTVTTADAPITVAPIRPPPVVAPIASPVTVKPPVAAPVVGNVTNVRILGELRKWHKITLAFTGPSASETDTDINPFMDFRLDVEFVHETTGKAYDVPGYFAADGNAAETSASSGTQWYCHFAPDEIGTWTYTSSFLTGRNIAVTETDTNAVPVAFDGQGGSFVIQPTNKTGRDHRGKGRLQYVEQHHMQFAETGEWFLLTGVDRYVQSFIIPRYFVFVLA